MYLKRMVFVYKIINFNLDISKMYKLLKFVMILNMGIIFCIFVYKEKRKE